MTIDSSQRRQRLRRATQSAHARLDTLIEDMGFLQDPSRYGRYLGATWAARKPAELALHASAADGVYAAWPERSVCHALGQDIVDVTAALPRETLSWAAPLSPGQALGVLYVLEGSALGARLLEQRAAVIGMTPTFGARHMARQTAQPKAWAAFVEILDDTALDLDDDALCIAAATDTFRAFEQAFQIASQ